MLQVEDLIDGMFSSSGIDHKDSLTYDDFKLMMREYKGDFIAIGLDCKGAKQNFLDTSTNVARWDTHLGGGVRLRHGGDTTNRLIEKCTYTLLSTKLQEALIIAIERAIN